ncbi:MAG: DUF6702 family protein [Cyclobacteriaceae bacterium]|jgi:hypothetical protein
MRMPFGKYLYLCLSVAASFRLQAAGCKEYGNSCQSTLNLELLTSNFQLLTSVLHPIHISVTEITYSEKDKALQITSRLFIDDLELSIRAQRKEAELDILEPKNRFTTQQLVINYLTEHFKIKLDGKWCKLTFLAVEREDISLIAYIEIEGVKKIKTLEVFNDAIMGTHEDQSNLVHVTYKSPVKSARLTSSSPSEKFVFEKNNP